MMQLPVELKTLPWKDRAGRISPLKAITFAAFFIPVISMLIDYSRGLWVIPVVGFVYWTGVWATSILLLALFITPARRIFHWNRVSTIRRMVGVGALIYTIAHLIFYFGMRFFDPAVIITETTTRISLIVATVSFVGLLALGLTSLDATIKWLGSRDWNRLHGLTYVITGLAVFHFVLSPGAYGGPPFLMLGIFFWLMTWRVLERRQLGTNIGVLAGLTVAATFVTVTSEVLWSTIMFESDPMMILGWNFNLDIGLSPGWMMLGLSTTVTVIAAIRQRKLAPMRQRVPS